MSERMHSLLDALIHIQLWRGRSKASSLKALALILLASVPFIVTACKSGERDANTVVFLIESSPANLDPRIGTDGQSEHIDELIFDGLVARDASFHFTPALPESWEQPH